ncbi:MAG TPA: GreA/GreB family elongation factor [Candidatus Hydrogenedentes bacterium]|nr:GreA/GreB family elongation factor [Candidatus Hydrogenedentota bacterium]HPG65852.1 GreA/GreB family elongation factor [Candidatus Hydrogenedentota bacterium]
MLNGVQPSAKVRRERERARRNDMVLDAAARVFQQRSYRQATMEDIAREAGYSVGSLYNLFGDKLSLFSEVITRIGERVEARLDQVFAVRHNAKKAFEDLIRLRLLNYSQDRLFFQTFSYPPDLGIEPSPEQLDARVNGFYQQYLRNVEGLFGRYLRELGRKSSSELCVARSLEGIIGTFMGYWSGPRQSDSFVQVARQICDVLLDGFSADRLGSGAAARTDGEVTSRKIYLTSFDLARLKELVKVARVFGRDACKVYLDALDAELDGGTIANPAEVPSDVVTMNSRVRVLDVETGYDTVCRLVFPKDLEANKENVSILSPLGTAMLGCRAGDVFQVPVPGTGKNSRCVIEQILYQPEAAGDYHL